MAKNNLKQILNKHSIDLQELSDSSKVSIALLRKLVDEKRSVAPLTMRQISNGITELSNKIIAVNSIFPTYDSNWQRRFLTKIKEGITVKKDSFNIERSVRKGINGALFKKEKLVDSAADSDFEGCLRAFDKEVRAILEKKDLYPALLFAKGNMDEWCVQFPELYYLFIKCKYLQDSRMRGSLSEPDYIDHLAKLSKDLIGFIRNISKPCLSVYCDRYNSEGGM